MDEKFVRVGVIIHDIGKIIYPCELFGAGSKHEAAGERLLLANGVCPKLARCCLSHGRYKVMKCSLEELIIALSDNLWKGTRNHSLEFSVIARIADVKRRNVWDIYSILDFCFEDIALESDERLKRSQLTLNNYLG